jgi:hypothetical protein
MVQDPIVEQIKRIREEYAARFNYDLEAIARDVRTRQDDGEHQLVRRPPRRVQPVAAAQEPKS